MILLTRIGALSTLVVAYQDRTLGGDMTTFRPVVVRNPSKDSDFAAAIDDLLADGVKDSAGFQERLRVRFPRVLVRPRDLSGERVVVWYVYREGHWVNEK